MQALWDTGQMEVEQTSWKERTTLRGQRVWTEGRSRGMSAEYVLHPVEVWSFYIVEESRKRGLC